MTTTTVTPAPAAVESTNTWGKGVALTLAGVLAGAGVATGLVLGLGGNSAAATQPQPVAQPSTIIIDDGSSPAGASTGGSVVHHDVTPLTPPTPPAPPVKPSAAIETLQKELGQLNYYEGPITGIMNAQTRQAITYLQRDAGLPQTGQMTAATQAALANFLAHGNNQMNTMDN
ncbi:peptidoglycan-binding domain-containing protein [Pseudonocardia thermophila]|uniref:peptidoglycan-binding domain-containing protein n=1 Tax=Pseudonocardia thermophila TaxID=1848 RepID=UPI00248EA3C5|nr:peptidoglycan-binding domain-containing protein [Pseudonocardia thermophila]